MPDNSDFINPDYTNRRRKNPAESTPSKPKKGAKSDKEKEPLAIVKLLSDKRLHGIIGVVMVLAGVYTIISFISYISSGAADQSLVENLSINQMSQHPQEVSNLCGPLGAWLAETLISKWLGVGAFVVVVYEILLGLSMLGARKCHFWSMTFRTLVLAIGLSIVLGGFTTPFMLGGVHGYEVNQMLVSTTSQIGRLTVVLMVIGIVVYVYLADLARLYNSYRRRVKAIREQRRLEKEQQQAEEAKVKQAMANAPGEDTPRAQEPAPIVVTAPQVTFADIPDTPADDQPEQTSDTATDTTVATPGQATMNVNVKPIEQGQGEVIHSADGESGPYDPRADLSHYRFPTLDLLIDRPLKEDIVDLREQEENKERITNTLAKYQIPIQHIEATVGPTVTLYEIIPAEGVRIAKIKHLEDDIAMSLAALGIRIIAPIPGKGTIGIEVPNKDPQTVSIRSVLGSKKFRECKYALPMAMGATIANEVFIADLTKMPHLLVAGATGQGKSVGLNTIIASLIYKKHPAELKFVLIDPKQVEFSLYERLERHFLAKLPDETEAIITKPERVVATLNSLCVEMENRYLLLKNANVRTVAEYNAKFTARRLNPEKGHRYLPYIVIIVDEFADLIMVAGKEVETPIARIAQKARAVGMHMIIATQRPSTDVITGLIKANFPGRIAFRVAQMVDSKTILDRPGANQLIGRGDMLFNINGEMTRVQCAFIDTPEVENMVDYIDQQMGYTTAYELPEYVPESDGSGGMGNITDTDSLFEECARIVVESGVASTSSLQRRYSIGYNRAGKIMDQLEAAGIVGPAQGGKPRSILVDLMGLERILSEVK